MSPFDSRIHDVRPHFGQLISASQNFRVLYQIPKLINLMIDCDRVQDAYSFQMLASSSRARDR